MIKDTSMPVLEYIKETAEHITMNDGKVLSASRFLEEFGFEGKIQYSPVSTLSGGELKRLYLVKLLLTNPNFLILDEPTNDFDIFTMNILEDFLINYKGCLLIVSHDRYFMDKVADTLFILEDNGDVSGFVGKCSEYIEYREELKAQKEEEERAKKTVERQSSTPTQSSTKTKLTFNEQKEFETLDKEIPELEEKKSLLEEKMSTTDYEELQKITEEYKAISTELEQKYERWEKLAEFV